MRLEETGFLLTICKCVLYISSLKGENVKIVFCVIADSYVGLMLMQKVNDER